MPVSAEHYAEFLTRMGHKVRVVDGVWWFNTSRGVYTSFPYDQNLNAETVPFREVLGRDGLVARFGCSVHQGVPSFRFLCDDPAYDFPNLRSRTRTQVRRGLEECQIEPVEFDVLRKSAVPLNADTLIRQGRSVPASLESYWQKYFDAASTTPGAEAWAAFADGQLAAYLIAFIMEKTSHVLIVRSATTHLKKYPNNALLFRYLHDRIRDPQIDCISYGYESIQSDLGSLDQFKVGMGFRAAECGQRVEISRWLKPFVNRYTVSPVSSILRQMGNGEASAKLRGILNWYQQQPILSSAAADQLSIRPAA